MKKICLCALLIGASAAAHAATTDTETITLASLLSDMTSPEANAQLPPVPYRTLQASSHDRRSASPDQPGWFANADGFGFDRTDTINGRLERVLLDARHPGAITRFWVTAVRKEGTLRFYFDGADEPQVTIDGYDLARLPLEGLHDALLVLHPNYTPDGKGGETLFLPMPFAQSCKVTFEEAPGIEPSAHYYQINYRQYPDGTPVETFILDAAQKEADAIKRASQWLSNPDSIPLPQGVRQVRTSGVVQGGYALAMVLPSGQNAVYRLTLSVDSVPADPEAYARLMRRVIVTADFDGENTIWCPLGDFSAGGFGGPSTESFFLGADGRGKVTCRFLMPYREGGAVALVNLGDEAVPVTMEAQVAPLPWTDRSMLFHASWRQQPGLTLTSDPDNDAECAEWRFATLQGQGMYKGDALTLYNASPAWYGEGDEKIWVDDDAFPSHFGTGTEDYYNCSWAPVHVFHTPYGGASRADDPTSHGYNTFYRTRCLDGIPFAEGMRFDLELLSWQPGRADFATTAYWYGRPGARALGTSGTDEALRPLWPAK